MTTSPPASDLARPAPVLALRVPTDEDAHHWHRVFADREVMEFHGGRPAELSVYQELTARQRRHDAELGYCLWTVTDAAGEVVGFTGAQPWPHAHFGPVGAIEIGWRLARTAWGRGYATAAARTTLERLRAAGVPAVVAMVKEGNTRSLAVAERLGMRHAETFSLPGGSERGRRYELAL
ncbi:MULTISPECIES: GNAT family N-acetyltransferase [Streptomyces]|uniref:GNAT family N-acetyltransferase n=1 Tax=Streptomyces evansiae TaxID=3075535 RepID=A0ABD5E2M9_9ACTN|nr:MULTISPECIES: GNAT family N-acetyltransferase [unclassified Streptomyces]ASY33364.1 N-acetyltransferase [Streptomyces sp. CLI2509]EGJ75428.1 putative acetyltransferase [Streptomyces sp. Tu6071]MDT0407468.1 GNAT family N-acetyltransferase [Streptomyces sp. DSM 41979]MDT0415241.1 GNAT family N-acetyltransferase [Streptomyces sp. DSM 41982]MDT0420480.1 GNAT family N-acetyltransferase [Streptomyces sp. DSM 41859]